MDVSDLIKRLATISNDEGGNPTLKKREQNWITKQNLNDSVSHLHVKGPSTATCMALTAYHSTPTDFIPYKVYRAL